jgi:hypothetical protein
MPEWMDDVWWQQIVDSGFTKVVILIGKCPNGTVSASSDERDHDESDVCEFTKTYLLIKTAYGGKCTVVSINARNGCKADGERCNNLKAKEKASASAALRLIAAMAKAFCNKTVSEMNIGGANLKPMLATLTLPGGGFVVSEGMHGTLLHHSCGGSSAASHAAGRSFALLVVKTGLQHGLLTDADTAFDLFATSCRYVKGTSTTS